MNTQHVRVWLERLLDVGVEPGDDDVTVERKRLLTGAGIFAPLNLIGLGAVYLAYGEVFAGVGYCAFGCWIWIVLLVFARWHRSVEAAFWMTGPVALLVQLAVIIDLGDMVRSGGLLLWGLAYPVATGVVFVPVRRMIPVFVLYAVNVIVAAVFGAHRHTALSDGPERAILAINLVTLSIFAVVILALFVNQRDRAYRLLGDEQRRARALLLSILPEKIADELTKAPRIIADHFDEVSVLFADVVGFTPLSATMTPVELVELLDDLFARFDELIEIAGLEKIKTIGDCYMVAAGIPVPRADHARALVTLALQMQAVARDEEFCGRRLQLRIGLNSGSVVAGVIGRRKFSYDLWGDVVNIASRMESHGVPGEVQLTASTHALVERDFEFTARGAIEVRGKGPLPVWLVTGRLERVPMTSEVVDGMHAD